MVRRTDLGGTESEHNLRSPGRRRKAPGGDGLAARQTAMVDSLVSPRRPRQGRGGLRIVLAPLGGGRQHVVEVEHDVGG